LKLLQAIYSHCLHQAETTVAIVQLATFVKTGSLQHPFRRH
jgi:hypothetical protein